MLWNIFFYDAAENFSSFEHLYLDLGDLKSEKKSVSMNSLSPIFPPGCSGKGVIDQLSNIEIH